MENIMRKVVCAIVGISLLCASLVGCSKSNPTAPSSSNPVEGTWNMTQQITITGGVNDTVNAGANNSQTWVINANNTFTNTQNMQSSSGNMSGTWATQGDTIIFTVPAILSQKCAYAVAGSSMTLTYEQNMFASPATVIEKYTKQ
jgi:hypothetical protein